VFVGETLRNLVHRRVLEPAGATFIARRAEQNKEFLASTDPWFHPVNFATGPDGALYIADFYRQWVEHPGFVPAKLRGQVEWRAGAELGRIWRVRSSKFKIQNSIFDLTLSSTRELVRHLEATNGWWRDMAQRLLIERRERAAAPLLRQIALHSPKPESRVQALHTLSGLDSLDDTTVLDALGDRHPRVREVALRLTEGRPGLMKRVRALAEDSDPRVRLQAALTIGEAEQSERVSTLVNLATRPDLDRITTLGIRSSLSDRPWLVLERVWTGRPALPGPRLLEFIRSVAVEVGAGSDDSDRQSLMADLVNSSHRPIHASHLALFAGYSQGLAAKDNAWRQRLRDWAAVPERARFLDELIALARDMASRTDAAPVSREIALATLARCSRCSFRRTSRRFRLARPPPSREPPIPRCGAKPSPNGPAARPAPAANCWPAPSVPRRESPCWSRRCNKGAWRRLNSMPPRARACFKTSPLS
jgi:hypothetical protein